MDMPGEITTSELTSVVDLKTSPQKTGPQEETTITSAMTCETDLKTSPQVGMRRTYSAAAMELIQRVTKRDSGPPGVKGEATPRTPRTVTERPKTAKALLTPKLPGERRKLPVPGSAKPKDRRPKTASSARTAHSELSSLWETKSGSESRVTENVETDGKPASRCGSAWSSASSGSRTSEASSVFLGGRRMEGLLQALHNERRAGGFFRRFIESSKNTHWRNNLNFWGEVQEYHRSFHGLSINRANVQKHAKRIFSLYVVVGAPRDIGLSEDVRTDVFRRLDPPFDELFDTPEESAISTLYVAWTQLVNSDNNTYKKVELIEVKRHLETKSKYVLNLQRRGLISQRVLTPEDPMEGYEDPVYDEALLEKIPEEFRDFTVDKLVHNRLELEHFRQFLTDNYAITDLLCWLDIEAFRRISHAEEKKRDSKARDIRVKYLNKKYFFGANSPAGKDGQNKVMAAGGGWGKLLDDRPPNPVLLEAQKYVLERLEKKWLPQFLALPDFGARQKPQQSMDDVIDDVIVQKRHKSQAVMKMLESKWITSSGDIMIFRKALLNPVTSLQFRRYVSIKGDSLENDVLFWLEVQKYKELHHTNTDDSTLLHKVNAIINCFLDSPIPPALQVDITQEVADKIIDRKHEKGPYLFREAQLTVFRVLFSHWTDFCEYRANLSPDKVLPTIERQRRRAKRKERARQERLEEQREKEAARRQAMGLPPEGNYDETDFHDPFATKAEGSEIGEEKNSTTGKDSVTWTYSRYMAALQTEDILNHLDESSLSSFTETGSIRPTEKDRISASVKTETRQEGKTGSLQSSKGSRSENMSLSKSNNKLHIDSKSVRSEKDDKSVSSGKTARPQTVGNNGNTPGAATTTTSQSKRRSSVTKSVVSTK